MKNFRQKKYKEMTDETKNNYKESLIRKHKKKFFPKGMTDDKYQDNYQQHIVDAFLL